MLFKECGDQGALFRADRSQRGASQVHPCLLFADRPKVSNILTPCLTTISLLFRGLCRLFASHPLHPLLFATLVFTTLVFATLSATSIGSHLFAGQLVSFVGGLGWGRIADVTGQ